MTLPLSHQLFLSPLRELITLFLLMIAIRRGGVHRIRRVQLLLGGDLIMIQPGGSLGNLVES